MVVYTCKKCGELNYLTPHAFWNISDFGAKCEKCYDSVGDCKIFTNGDPGCQSPESKEEWKENRKQTKD